MRQISQMEPWIGQEEKDAVAAYLDSGGWLTEFKRTTEFASLLAKYVGAKHCTVVSNGTVSLFLALRALGIVPGDEVIVPDFTMIASANAVLLAGALPVFVDVSPENLCLDLDLAEAAITGRTRAIMLVSLNGRSPDMRRARGIADRHGVALLEDAAQSLGSLCQGQHLGTFGQIGSFSFSAPKVITTGQGGALVTDDTDLYDRLMKLRDFGRARSGVDFHVSVGYNFKFTDLQAVIGIEQMKKLPWRVQRKKEIYALYRQAIRSESVRFLDTRLEDSSPWFIDVLVPDPLALQAHLKLRGIGSRPFYPAIHSQPAYGWPGHFPNSDYAAAHGLWLPSSSFLGDDDVHRVCAEITDFYANAKLR